MGRYSLVQGRDSVLFRVAVGTDDTECFERVLSVQGDVGSNIKPLRPVVGPTLTPLPLPTHESDPNPDSPRQGSTRPRSSRTPADIANAATTVSTATALGWSVPMDILRTPMKSDVPSDGREGVAEWAFGHGYWSTGAVGIARFYQRRQARNGGAQSRRSRPRETKRKGWTSRQARM